MNRIVPKMTTDEEAEAFLEQDLSDLDFSQFKSVRFEFENVREAMDRALDKTRKDG